MGSLEVVDLDWDPIGKCSLHQCLFSTHMPESITIADKTGIDVETYIQIYNATGFLLQVCGWGVSTSPGATGPPASTVTVTPVGRRRA